MTKTGLIPARAAVRSALAKGKAWEGSGLTLLTFAIVERVRRYLGVSSDNKSSRSTSSGSTATKPNPRRLCVH